MKIEKSLWFSGPNIPGIIGLAMGVDEVTGRKKAYIGVGAGFSETIDGKAIAEAGSPVSAAVLQEAVNYLGE